MSRSKRIAVRVAVLIPILLVVSQAVPYGRDHTDPKVVTEPKWDSPQTRALAARACFDCHSNETRWPWYASVAPVSWLVQHDVDEGRDTMNFSEWNHSYRRAHKAPEAVLDGDMPPATYRLMHPPSRLTSAEKKQLAAGLRATFGSAAPPAKH